MPQPDAPAPFLYFELLPPATLREHVHAYWGFDVRTGDPGTHTVWPDGCLSLVVRIGPGQALRTLFSGPRVTPLEVPLFGGDRFRGVRLRPWAAGPLLGVDPAAVRDRAGPLEELLPRMSARLMGLESASQVIPALEELLLDRRTGATPIDPLVRAAAEALSRARGDRAIGDVARAVGLSARQLRRRFRAGTGLSPKEYARVRRLRTAAEVRLRDGDPWSQLAARLGFADQAHLVREVGRMTGVPPTLLEGRLRLIEHRGVRA